MRACTKCADGAAPPCIYMIALLAAITPVAYQLPVTPVAYQLPAASPRARPPTMLAAVVAQSRDALAQQLGSSSGSTISCMLHGHTRVSLRRYDSTCWSIGGVVPCLSLTNIEVDTSHRRQGHARTALAALKQVAGESRRLLVVENVVSPHMHAIIDDLQGQPLPGNRVGAKGCHYYLPPSPGAAPADYAV